MSKEIGNRRLRLVQGGVLLVGLAICVRLVELQIFRHDELLQRAQLQWETREILEPARGTIRDRNERVLAQSVISWRIGVAGSRVKDAALLAGEVAPLLKMSQEEFGAIVRAAGGGHRVLKRDTVLPQDILAKLRCYPSITLDQIKDRFYHFGGTGAALIGFHRADPGDSTMSTGLEAGLSTWLTGTPGEGIRIEAARPGESMGYQVLQRPRHGRNVQLSLDIDLQAICEERLADSVRKCSAIGGAVLVADPSNGDILAAASWPLVKDRSESQADPAVWQNFNIARQYEPGSVFKIFTAVSLLKHSAVDTAAIFDCDDTDFGTFTIRNSDSHAGGMLNFDGAFTHSSNVYFARATANLKPGEFYRDLLDLGFGSLTSYPSRIQAPGSLEHFDEWSGRSRETIAIGQEISVTPLQLVMAGCAVANGGYLFAPRIIQRVCDNDGVLLEECRPRPLRRVMSEQQAAFLRETMMHVVEAGTGKTVDLPWITAGGKTGTAQKCKDGVGYEPGAYMSSFMGFVPAETPRLVVLTILDEPDYAHHYAAQSAAPLFGQIITEIGSSTNWLKGLGRARSEGAPTVADIECVTVPDVLFLSANDAIARLQRAGLVAAGDGRDGTVFETVPGPGAACPKGARVQINVQAGGPVDARTLCPDLRGLSNREVYSLAARLGVEVRVEGFGYVSGQTPSPGRKLERGLIEVRMDPSWR